MWAEEMKYFRKVFLESITEFKFENIPRIKKCMENEFISIKFLFCFDFFLDVIISQEKRITQSLNNFELDIAFNFRYDFRITHLVNIAIVSVNVFISFHFSFLINLVIFYI